MDTRGVGQTGFATAAIGLGCMGFSQGYGAVDEDESRRAILAALDAGVEMLDTAMSYGQGANERLIQRVLDAGARTAQVATKFGIARGEDGVHLDARPERAAGDCEASLARLGREVIDLYYLHRPDPAVPISESVGAMAELVAAGKVRHLGVSEVTPTQLREAAAVHPIAAVQFEWSLLWREPEAELIPAARELGVGLVPYSPLGRGLLTARLDDAAIQLSPFRRDDPRFAGANLVQNRSLTTVLAELAAEYGASAGQLALAWLLAQGDDVVPIPGSRRAERVLENVGATELRLDAEDLARIESALPAGAWAGDRRSFAAAVTARPAPGTSATLSSPLDGSR